MNDDLVKYEALAKNRRNYGSETLGDAITELVAMVREARSGTTRPIRDIVLEEAAKVADDTAKCFKAYRDHFPHAEGAETVSAQIRALKGATEGGRKP